MSDTDRHLSTGISRRMVDSVGIIIGPAWRRAADERELVGSCRQPRSKGTTCEGYLRALEPYTVDEHVWYEAVCLSCHMVVVAPKGATLPRSSRRSQMPEGAWERRTKELAAAFGKVAA